MKEWECKRSVEETQEKAENQAMQRARSAVIPERRDDIIRLNKQILALWKSSTTSATIY